MRKNGRFELQSVVRNILPILPHLIIFLLLIEIDYIKPSYIDHIILSNAIVLCCSKAELFRLAHQSHAIQTMDPFWVKRNDTKSVNN